MVFEGSQCKYQEIAEQFKMFTFFLLSILYKTFFKILKVKIPFLCDTTFLTLHWVLQTLRNKSN